MGKLYPLYLASVFSVFVPVLSGVSSFKRIGRDLKLLLVLFILAASVEVYTYFLSRLGLSIHWLHHLYMPVEYAIFAWVFSMWQEDNSIKRVTLFSIVLFLAICVLDLLNFKGLQRLNSFTGSVACLFYVLLAIHMIFNLMKADTGAIYKNPRFMISAALLIYGAGSLLYFAFDSYQVSLAVWAIYSGINIVANILYGVGFLCRHRQVLSGA